MLRSPSHRNQTGTGCGVPVRSTVVNQPMISSRSRRAARLPNVVLSSITVRRLSPLALLALGRASHAPARELLRLARERAAQALEERRLERLFPLRRRHLLQEPLELLELRRQPLLAAALVEVTQDAADVAATEERNLQNELRERAAHRRDLTPFRLVYAHARRRRRGRPARARRGAGRAAAAARRSGARAPGRATSRRATGFAAGGGRGGRSRGHGPRGSPRSPTHRRSRSRPRPAPGAPRPDRGASGRHGSRTRR